VDSFPQPLTHCLVRLRLLNTLWLLVGVVLVVMVLALVGAVRVEFYRRLVLLLLLGRQLRLQLVLVGPQLLTQHTQAQ
jgi:hypothetical protein